MSTVWTVDAVTAGRVVERWHRSAPGQDAARPAESHDATGGGAEHADRLVVEVVGIPGLAASLTSELSPAVWQVREVDADRHVSSVADAVVLDAPAPARVAQVRRAAPGARLLATFSGPAPGPLREAALRAGVDVCLEGTSAAVVASYLEWVSGILVAPDRDPQLPDVHHGG